MVEVLGRKIIGGIMKQWMTRVVCFIMAVILSYAIPYIAIHNETTAYMRVTVIWMGLIMVSALVMAAQPDILPDWFNK